MSEIVRYRGMESTSNPCNYKEHIARPGNAMPLVKPFGAAREFHGVVPCPWNYDAADHPRQLSGRAFRGAWFVSNNYALPITYFTRQWAYQDQTDTGMRLTIGPTSGRHISVAGVVIYSSNRCGRWAGGGMWDTYHYATRPVGIARDASVLNYGLKRMLDIPVSRPTTLYLYFADGTMLKFWTHFVLRIEGGDGSVSSILINASDGGTMLLRSRSSSTCL